MTMLFKLSALCAALVALSGCTSSAHTQKNTISSPLHLEQTLSALDQPALPVEQIFKLPITVEDAHWIEIDGLNAQVLTSSKTQGLSLWNSNAQRVQHIPGSFSKIDYRSIGQQLIIQTTDLLQQQPIIFRFDLNTGTWAKPVYLAARSFKTEDNCLYLTPDQSLYSFLVGEEGIGEQWMIQSGGSNQISPRFIRNMSLPPNSGFCVVDDYQDKLYINEEDVGIWAYEADPEADLIRYPVDLNHPHGSILGNVSGLSLIDNALAAMDESKAMLYRYRIEGTSWHKLPPLSLQNVDEPERISLKGTQDQKQLLLVDDQIKLLNIDWTTQALPPKKAGLAIPADVETDLVPSRGDAADDPAIWVNQANPRLSRVLGTDKQGGLAVYDLNGKQLQYLKVGRLNNVDIRPNFKLGQQTVDLAIATNRDQNSLHLFSIHQKTGQVKDLGELPTDLNNIYGFCMYQNRQGETFAIPNDKNGTFVQYKIQSKASSLSVEEVLRFKVSSQPEGCVVDDEHDRIYIGEEAKAVWTTRLDDPKQIQLQPVITVGEQVKADIEGLAIYKGQVRDYLVISSQGDDSYVIVDAAAPYQLRGKFKISANLNHEIDAVSETDGLEVTSANLGGIWKKGMLVVQDGRKRMPEGNQNYKYVAWEKIAQALGLE